MSERIILGNPCLNDLGFASNKHSIELRAFGIEFPIILSDEVSESPQGERGLRINRNYNVQPVGGSWMVQTVWCHPGKGIFSGTDDVAAGSSPPGGGQESATQMWLQDGAQPIDGVYVIEGPATIVEGRVPVQLLCTRTAQFGPGNKMINLR